jgi:hypothetical protein
MGETAGVQKPRQGRVDVGRDQTYGRIRVTSPASATHGRHRQKMAASGFQFAQESHVVFAVSADFSSNGVWPTIGV